MTHGYFILFLLGGFLLQKRSPQRFLGPLKALCVVNLYLLVFSEFLKGIAGLTPSLVLAGLFLPLACALIGLAVFRRNAAWREIALSYSTFGGGNRGLMAILMFAPQQLRAFIAFDLGIFLALGFLPLLENKLGHTATNATRLSSFQSILFIALAAGLGGLLGQIDLLAALAPELRTLLGWIALVSIPTYLGYTLKIPAAFDFRQFILFPIIFRLAVFLPLGLLLAFAFPKGQTQDALIYLILLYALLPASSMAPQCIRDPALAEKLNQHVTCSSLLFIAGLSITALIKS